MRALSLVAKSLKALKALRLPIIVSEQRPFIKMGSATEGCHY